MTKTSRIGLSSLALHMLALVLMLCDHLWATIVPGAAWLTWLGRLAFPIFAFLIAEGYRHTRNFKKYALRMLLFALVSEIPFNLMYGSSVIYPFHQNVMWTFLIALLALRLMDKVKRKGKWWLTAITVAGVSFLGFWLCTLLMTDYYGEGFLTVVLFWLLPGKTWWHKLGWLLGLAYINMEMIKGLQVPVELFGTGIEISQQSFAVLSIIPILLYNGKPGRKNKVLQYGRYAFYPAHMLILWLIYQAL